MKKFYLILIFVGLFTAWNLSPVDATDHLSLKSTTHHTPISESSRASTITGAQTIKVLIYNGKNADEECVEGIETSLTRANQKKLVPGYFFTWHTSTFINSAVLKYYNVLVMPGGDDYINDEGETIKSINPQAVKSFVANGGGYMGICAGAFSGAKYTEGWYYGWGVAPHVLCKGPEHVGRLSIKITDSGRQLLGYGGTKTTLYWNGPAMYAKGKMITFAQYADNIIGARGMGAIVGDYYGKGRTVLSGPHPELDPQLPDIVAHLVVWSANLPKTTVFKVISTTPAHLKTGVSRKSKISITFSKLIKVNSSFNYITVKDLTRKKYLKIFKTITLNVLNITTETRYAYDWFQVTIPAKAVKDISGHNLASVFFFRFRTGYNLV